jgi:endonuclease/exonuclease/phosphatase family metal-dependent hydrolase
MFIEISTILRRLFFTIAIATNLACGDMGIDPEVTRAAFTNACDPTADISVMTFNIRYDAGGSGSYFDSNGWLYIAGPRRDKVSSVINAFAPDIFGVQEALNHQVKDMIGMFPDYVFVGVGRDDGDTAGEYAGIFYRAGRFSERNGGTFWLSTTPDVPGTVFAGSGSIRIATWVSLVDELTGNPLIVLNTHLDNFSASSRERSATLIRQRLETLTGGVIPAIVTGDFNTGPNDTPLAIMKSASPSVSTQMIDGYRVANPTVSPQEATYHSFTGSTSGQRIDFILHTDAWRTNAAEIVHTAFGSSYPSDHFPVTGVLSWEEGAQGPCP